MSEILENMGIDCESGRERIEELCTSNIFYFSKLKDLWNQFKNYNIQDNNVNEIINELETMKPFSFQRFLDSYSDDYTTYDFILLIGKIISIIDLQAYNKNIWNPYDDKRVIAKSFIRQNKWTMYLLQYKINIINDFPKIIKNTIELIETPRKGLTQLSENHREQVSKNLLKIKYNSETYFEDLKNYFEDEYGEFELPNMDNIGVLLGALVYCKENREIWEEKESEEVRETTLGTSSYEAEFREYLRVTPTQQGNLVEENQINYMINDLNSNIPTALQIPNESLLTYDDIEFLEEVKGRLRNGGDLYNFNYSLGNGRPSRALYQYINFLNNRNDTGTVQMTPLETNNMKAKNEILFGAPGTGKTYKMQELQNKYDEYVTVTFHQSYGYEDFIEGLKAKIDEDNNQVYYEVEKGIFREICQKAIDNPNKNFAIFIDEINRGNISKIFGELITIIELTKRGMKVTLPYSKKQFYVPENLSIIGTMNTADRSIALLDTALRRRFEFIEMIPIPNHEEISQDIDGINVQKLLSKMNDRIEYLYDRNHLLGHAYFIGISSKDSLKNVFKNKIIPLLQEYFYDDWGKINLVFNNNGFITVKDSFTEDTLFSNCDFEDYDEDKKSYEVRWGLLNNTEEYKKIYE